MSEIIEGGNGQHWAKRRFLESDPTEPPCPHIHAIQYIEEQHARAAYFDTFNTDRELLQRLNLRLKGIDPGRPLNWRGLP